MSRIRMLEREDTDPGGQAMWDEIVQEHGIMTNMKKTLVHSPAALKAVMEWYSMLDAVKPFLGERMTGLFMLAVSTQTDCLVCSTYYRRVLVENGEDPDNLVLTPQEDLIVRFGRKIATDSVNVSDEMFAQLKEHYSDRQIVDLTVFGAMMVVNNIFNNVVDVDLDEYLQRYRKATASSWPAPEVLSSITLLSSGHRIGRLI